MADGSAGSFAAAASGDTLVEGAECRPFASRRGPTGFSQRATEPFVAGARAAALAFAAAFAITRAHAGPRREMTGRRESFHVDADLGEDDPGRLDMQPGNRAEPLQLSVEGAIQFLKLRLDPPDRLIESGDLVQLLTQQPTLRLAH